jgi:hypothetical protein
MPDRRLHRGPHPDDHELFAPKYLPSLRAATHDLSWLLERRYAPESALKLVGDRYQLKARQRAAVQRAACPDSQVSARRARQLTPDQLHGQTLCIDGFNVITSLEVALSGGVLLIGRDGVLRDIAGVHGSYRRVEETEPAFMLIARLTEAWSVAQCEFYLDRPVSNSGRLRAFLLQLIAAYQLPFSVFVVPNPDRVLMASGHVVASADSQILNADVRWLNLARECVTRAVPHARLVDLSPPRAA